MENLSALELFLTSASESRKGIVRAVLLAYCTQQHYAARNTLAALPYVVNMECSDEQEEERDVNDRKNVTKSVHFCVN